jgi:hypothetical protein
MNGTERRRAATATTIAGSEPRYGRYCVPNKIDPTARCSTWIPARVRYMGSKKAAPTTATSRRSVITRCSCSMTKGTAWRRSCALGTSPARDDWEKLLVPEIDRQQDEGTARRVPGRRRLCAAGHLRGAGGTRRGLRHPHPGEQGPGSGDRRHPVSVASSAQSQAARPVQDFPLAGRQLDHGPAGRGESRAPRGRAVPGRRLHRDESPAPQSRGRAVLQQARDRRAMDQGRQASGALDATVVSSVPGE